MRRPRPVLVLPGVGMGGMGALRLPGSTWLSPQAWPQKPRPPVSSFGTSEGDALVLCPQPSPAESSSASLMGCLPLSASCCYTGQRASQGSRGVSKCRVQRLIWRGQFKTQTPDPRPIKADAASLGRAQKTAPLTTMASPKPPLRKQVLGKVCGSLPLSLKKKKKPVC